MKGDKMNIVKYNNNLNSVGLRSFTAEELDLLMSICHKLKDKGIEEIKISYYDLKKLIQTKKNPSLKEFTESIMNVNRKLLALNFTIVENNEIIQFAMFKEFRTNPQNQILTIAISDRFKFLLNDFEVGNWTRFELKEFLRLNSNYTKEFYRRMKQFRKTGFWKCDIEEFRNLLNIPRKYRITDIDTRILKPIMKELGEEYNLKIEKKYGFPGGRGRSRVVGFEFRFSPERKEDIVIDDEENNDNPISLSKPGKSERKEEPEIVSEIKSRLTEAVPEQEKEKTLREKLKEKIDFNNENVRNLGFICEGIKKSPKLKDSFEKLTRKIERAKEMNIQLEAIYNLGEEDFTQEIVELAEELLASKI